MKLSRRRRAAHLRRWPADLPRAQIVNIQPGDTLVVYTQPLLNREQIEHMKARLQSALPMKVRVLVFDNQARLDVLRARLGDGG
jgi:hypothetical protein